MVIRRFESAHWPGIWSILEPVFREGTTYAVPRDISEAAARDFWTGPDKQVWVAVEEGQVVGSYFLKPNQMGGGSHVCNCGYVTSPEHRGKGIATQLCEHSQEQALANGFRAMQFNFVVSTNERAVSLWERMGYGIVGRLPGAFAHPEKGFVDALVMFKMLL